VNQSTAATDQIIGVAENGPRTNPLTMGSTTLYDGFAAISGEDVNIYGVGEVCMLRLGATVVPGALLTADSSGRGITATTGQHYGARAQMNGVIDQLIEVLVITGTL